MSSPAVQRSASRGRSRTPAEIKTEDDVPMDDLPNGTRPRTRSATRSPSHDRSRSLSRSRSRSRSYRSNSRSDSRTPTRTPSPSIPRSAKIVIEKLTKNVNDAHLREIFSTYGAIQDLEMPMNRQFMMNKGIAYILYADAKHAESAIAHMHEAQLDGALINVSIVLPRRRFSRSPPARKPPPNRFGEPHRMRDGPAGMRGPPPTTDRAFGRPVPSRASPGYGGRGGRRSPPPSRYGRGGWGAGAGVGAGGGYRERYDDRNSYRPGDRSPSRSPRPRRRRSPSYDKRSRSPSRTPLRRRDDRRRRSLSYSSFSSRSRSRSVDRSGGRRR